MYNSTLILLSAILLELLSTTVGVIGFTSLFGQNWIIIALVIVLDIVKFISVSIVFNIWEMKTKFAKIMSTLGILMASIMMLISSAGIAGYFSAEFQKSMSSINQNQTKITLWEDQLKKLEIDKQRLINSMNNVATTATVNQRIRMSNQYKSDLASVEASIKTLEENLMQLKLTNIESTTKSSSILLFASAFNIPVEKAIQIIIGLLVFVFDPVAVYLVLIYNMIIKNKQTAKETHQISVKSEEVKPEEVKPEEVIEDIKNQISMTSEPVATDPIVTEVSKNSFNEIVNNTPEETKNEVIKLETLLHGKQKIDHKSSLTDIPTKSNNKFI